MGFDALQLGIALICFLLDSFVRAWLDVVIARLSRPAMVFLSNFGFKKVVKGRTIIFLN